MTLLLIVDKCWCRWWFCLWYDHDVVVVDNDFVDDIVVVVDIMLICRWWFCWWYDDAVVVDNVVVDASADIVVVVTSSGAYTCPSCMYKPIAI